MPRNVNYVSFDGSDIKLNSVLKTCKHITYEFVTKALCVVTVTGVYLGCTSYEN